MDVLFVGGGPCTLGLICNAIRNNRIADLLSDNGIAIVEKTGVFGGGYLQHFGLNSNTAGDGFIRSIMQKEEKKAEGFTSPSPVRTKVAMIPSTNNNKNWMQDVMNSKKNIEEMKESKEMNDNNDPVVGGHDSDNELDYDYEKKIDNSQPLKAECGRDKIKKSSPMPNFKQLFFSDIC